LTGLYTFRLFFLVFRGEPDDDLRARHHAHHGKEGPSSMILPVGVLALGAVVSGWIQFADFWAWVGDWLDPVAEPLAHPSGTQELVTSVVAVGVGLLGIAVAWAVYVAGRVRVPKAAFARRVLE